jgi:hypothetical protein
MTMSKFICLCVGVLLVAQTNAQKIYSNIFTDTALAEIRLYEDSIDMLSGIMLHDTSANTRFIACKFMIKHLVKVLKNDNSFEYQFPQLERISIQYPEDSSFRIFTWQLYVSANDYRYYGAIQLKDKSLKLFPLSDRSNSIQNPTMTLTDNNQWFGTLYYKIKTVESTKFGKYYLLFGYDAFSFFERQKVIDVLQFKENKPVFGLPVFNIPPDIEAEKKRIAAMNLQLPNGSKINISDKELLEQGETTTMYRFIVTYSAESSAILNYDPDYELILFDNFIEVQGNYEGQGMTHVPDGSYRGFRLQPDGTWLQIEKVFNDFQEEAPRPVPLDRTNRLPNGN